MEFTTVSKGRGYLVDLLMPEIIMAENNNNLNKVEDQLSDLSLKRKQNVNFVFVGHVDAGKSTISGQIL